MDLLYILQAQGNAALCAGMLKDFIVYEQEISTSLAVHHVLTVSGTLLSVALPVGNGLAATIAVVAEFGSSCLNLYVQSVQMEQDEILSYCKQL